MTTTPIDLGDMDDKEVFAIAVCWSAIKQLPRENLDRVLQYLMSRAVERMRGEHKTITELIKEVEILKQQADQTP